MSAVGDQGFFNATVRNPKGGMMEQQIPATVYAVDAKGRLTLDLGNLRYLVGISVGTRVGEFTPGVTGTIPAAPEPVIPQDPAALAAAQEALKLAQAAHAQIDAQGDAGRGAVAQGVATLQAGATAAGARLDALEATGAKS